MILLLLVFIWRIYLFFIAFLSSRWLNFVLTFPYSEGYLIRTKLPQFLWAWGNFDGVHYITIAKEGYIARYTQAFFPVYPLILRFFGKRFNDYNLIFSGITLSFVFFIISVLILNNLVKLDYSKKISYWTIIFLLIFPTSFFFSALYTESLFLLLTVSAFWFARKHQWVLSGLCGSLASATRITGIMLLPALLWEYYQYKVRGQKSNMHKGTSIKIIFHKSLNFVRLILDSPLLYLIPLGLISYMVYLQSKYGDWLYFWHAQSVFGTERSGYGFIIPVQTLWRYIKILFTVSLEKYHFWTAVWELGAYLLGVGLLIIGHKQGVRLSYLIFSWLVILVPSFTGTLSSMPRYLLAAFPIFIILGNSKSSIRKIFLIFGFLLLQVIFLISFISGRWVA